MVLYHEIIRALLFQKNARILGSVERAGCNAAIDAQFLAQTTRMGGVAARITHATHGNLLLRILMEEKTD
jgi:hypothetical protein